MQRPSHKELFGKIVEARLAVSQGQVLILELETLAQDALELEYDIETELLTILKELLEETEPEHYVGTRPPQRSYEHEITDLELFAFVRESSRFDCYIYYKFALAQGKLWLVSLHQDRSKKEEP
jgi:hypothetical protein